MSSIRRSLFLSIFSCLASSPDICTHPIGATFSSSLSCNPHQLSFLRDNGPLPLPVNRRIIDIRWDYLLKLSGIFLFLSDFVFQKQDFRDLFQDFESRSASEKEEILSTIYTVHTSCCVLENDTARLYAMIKADVLVHLLDIIMEESNSYLVV